MHSLSACDSESDHKMTSSHRTQLPDPTFNTLILGTGLLESILAASLSRLESQEILHMDVGEFYGGDACASVTLEQLHHDVLGHVRELVDEQSKEDAENDASPAAENIIQNPDTTKEQQKDPESEFTLEDNESLVPFEYQSPLELIAPQESPDTNSTSSSGAGDTDTSSQYNRNLSFLKQQLAERKNRHYAIDLQLKLLFCSAPMVNLLIKSRIGRYLEFKCMDAVVMYMDGKWSKVPCSKGEIFKSKLISLRDKRYMSKFMKLCLQMGAVQSEEAEGEGSTSNSSVLPQLSKEELQMPFVQFLKEKQKLSEKLIQMICCAITLMSSLDEPMSTEDGMKRVKMYIDSVGRYGTTSFLYPVYGLSELPQSFCRVGAVYGGTYMLKSSVQNLCVAENNTTTDDDTKKKHCTAIQCDLGQRVKIDRIIANSNFRPQKQQGESSEASSETKYSILRCISISKQPILDPLDFKNQSNPRQMYHPHSGALLMIVPPKTFGEEQTHAIHITQLDFTSRVCPKDEYLISFQTQSTNYDALKRCVEEFIPATFTPSPEQNDKESKEEAEQNDDESNTEDAPSTTESSAQEQDNILYQVFYRYHVRDECSLASDMDNMIQVNSMNKDIHCENLVEEARKIFHSLYPKEIFLEQLPNPELDNEVYDESAKLLGVDREEEDAAEDTNQNDTDKKEEKTTHEEEEKSQAEEQTGEQSEEKEA